MRKVLTLIGCALLLAGTAAAQPLGTVAGKLTDASTGEAISGATIDVVPLKNPGAKKRHTTGRDGSIEIRSLAYGEYRLVFSSMGHETLEKTVNVNAPRVNLGTLSMDAGAISIGEVTLDVIAMRTSVRGDTVSYNADAFKVAADADTEGLLAKMPGITVSGGTVEAQGQEVKKVLVDGREFFGDDVTSAIRNLPAEVVDRVEVFDRLSDQAEFTGIDDGQGYKAINIVTRQDKRSGQFGKLYGAWGFNRSNSETGSEWEFDKYIVGGNVNIFEGTSRISLIGLANNLNQQNFSFEDIIGVVNTGGSSSGGGRMGGYRGGGTRGFMVRPQDGVATVQAFGVNYSDLWGKKKKLEFSGSYFFNHARTVNENTSQRWSYTDDPNTIIFTESNSNSLTENFNHRFSSRLDYKINDNHNIMIRPSISFQTNDGASTTISNVSTLENGVSTPSNGTYSVKDNERTGYYGRISALYRAKLGKQGRTLTVNLEGSLNGSNSLGFPREYEFIPEYDPEAQGTEITNQKNINRPSGYRMGGGVTYTEPLNKSSLISFEYNIQYNHSDIDRRVYRWLESAAAFDENYDELLSSMGNSGYITHRIGPGYRLTTKKATISANVSYQNATMTAVETLPMETDSRYSFDNVVYSGMANFNFNPANSLRIHARSNTSNPSASELSSAVDISNRASVTTGNPGLVPTYNNRLFTHYVNTNVIKGRTFTLMAGIEAASNYIADSIVINNRDFPVLDGTLGEGNQFTKPVNMDGQWRLFSGVSYGFPVKFLRSNLNIDLGGMFGETPGIINGDKYKMTEQYLNGGITLGSNISEKIDFTVRYSGSYNTSTSISFVKKGAGSTEALERKNKYVSQNVTGSLKWIIWKGITFSTNTTFTQERGITDDYNEEYIICNIYVGKKIFRNQRGEISFGVNDLLDQNTSFRRIVRSNYILNSTNSAIGRYFSVQLIYNLRNFGKRASRNSGDYEGIDQQSSGGVGVQRTNTRGPGMMGPPPGRR